MSQETLEWLNQNTLIGFTDQRGNAWHYDADFQGDESNQYPGAIPVEDVLRRLFHWQALEGQVESNILTESGVIHAVDSSRKAIIRSDTAEILGIFKSGYRVHQYAEWLLSTVSTLLDDDLSIGSAGQLRKGAVAWVSVEVPENIVTPSGVVFRPRLLASTSHDGTLATTFKRTSNLVVCDNTLSAALGSAGEVFKVKHSRFSEMKLQDARDALNIIFTLADEFTEQVEALCATTVTDKQFQRFLDSLVPVPKKEGAGHTRAINKRASIVGLYDRDERVSPWHGSAFGVLQAVNTFEHHEAQVRSIPRPERNMLRTIKGEFDQVDSDTLERLAAVLA